MNNYVENDNFVGAIFVKSSRLFFCRCPSSLSRVRWRFLWKFQIFRMPTRSFLYREIWLDTTLNIFLSIFLQFHDSVHHLMTLPKITLILSCLAHLPKKLTLTIDEWCCKRSTKGQKKKKKSKLITAFFFVASIEESFAFAAVRLREQIVVLLS